ncbi:alpha/beta hydrolase [Acetobacter sp. AN02]|uniref:alpha/beta fold hydrolase n=1 Tax=Acetobacter sp. AN02 TaxID=2894186 RepID=UPI0024342C54|nr:alpha/beta fold hydrolase [Acetobacter sp. AN02]MDG6095420.1 alpha/beta hydrolase [Acetobacter sp. AN02]
MLPVILVHGWGFDASVWDRVRACRGMEDAGVTDFGFFGDATGKHVSLNEDFTPPGPVLVAGHSMGLLWLLRHAVLPAGSRIAGISGFSCFVKKPDFPDGVHARVLARMQAGLSEDPLSVLASFRKNCGLEEDSPCRDADVDSLREGLDFLENCDVRDSGRDVCVLCAEQDRIVSPAMSRACFPEERITWIAGGSHMLPLTHPEECTVFLLDRRKIPG